MNQKFTICKFFFQSFCAKCSSAKVVVEELKKRNVLIEEYDVASVKGLTEATMCGVLSTPTLLLSTGTKSKIYTENFQEILMEEIL